jgi:uncharacterized protein involved in copper resistance
MIIRIGRTIFAVLIGLSVATLPAATGFAAGATTATEISASEAMPDCDHHHHNAPSDKTQKTAHDAACMAGCALTCFSFTATGFSGIAFSSPASAALKPVRTGNNISSRMGSPPFRPPRS